MAKRKLEYNGVNIDEVKTYYCCGWSFRTLEEAIDYIDALELDREYPTIDRANIGYLPGIYDKQIDHMLKVEGLIHANNY